MYKVMLVDDEKLILNGLKLLIDWEEIGLEFPCTAGNGEEALELFRQNPVDIVITDIRMPKMSGLMLIENLKKINPDTRYIILSGYDDFSYAKQAIHLGIENYIIKPINEVELTETLVETIKKLDAIERTPIIEGQKLELIRENILHRWVHNNISNYELEERNTILDINLSMDYYCVGIIRLDADPLLELEEKQRIYSTIKRRMYHLDSEAFVDLESNLVCILGGKSLEELDRISHSFFSGIVEEIKTNCNINSFVAIGSIEKGFRKVSESYATAIKLKKYLLVSGYNTIVDCNTFGDHATEQEQDQAPANEDMFDAVEFHKAVIAKEKEQVYVYVKSVFDHLCAQGDVTPEKIQNLAVRIVLVMSDLTDELGFAESHTESAIKENILDICRLDTIEELMNALMTRIGELIEKLSTDTEIKSPIVRRIVALIREEYNSELSLKTLGLKFNVNPSYLGQLFYKETGEQFSEYLNRIRNEHARAMLLNTDQRIHEIAKCVGYTDNSYFYKKFKEVYGVSPNTLRNSRNYN